MIISILTLADTDLPTTAIPDSIRALVYLVGMVGFPVVVTVFVLTRLSDKLKSVDKSLLELSDRISERPMGLERSTDFIIYLCEALQNELIAGLQTLVYRDLSFRTENGDKESIARTLTIIKREMAGFLRPIFRKHDRFASRFPTVGGNLASMFTLAAPSEQIDAGQTEARLVGQTYKNPAEATLAMLMNNIIDFGNPALKKSQKRLTADGLPPQLAALFESSLMPDSADDQADETAEPALEAFDVIERDQFFALCVDGVETVCTILRDSMLEQVRANASEFDTRLPRADSGRIVSEQSQASVFGRIREKIGL